MKRVLALVLLSSASACSASGASSVSPGGPTRAESEATTSTRAISNPYASVVSTVLATDALADIAATPLGRALDAATASLEISIGGSQVPHSGVTSAALFTAAKAIEHDAIAVQFGCTPTDLVAGVPQLKLEVAGKVLGEAVNNRVALDSGIEVDRGLLGARLKGLGINDSGRSLAELRQDARTFLGPTPDIPEDAAKEIAVYVGLLTQAWEMKEFGPLAPAEAQARRNEIYRDGLSGLDASVTLDGAPVDIDSLPLPPAVLDIEQVSAECGGPTSISSQTSPA